MELAHFNGNGWNELKWATFSLVNQSIISMVHKWAESAKWAEMSEKCENVLKVRKWVKYAK